MTTTSTTPGGYTSRFVAHVAQTTAHDEATSNSSNPHDRNRFRAFSADGSTDERGYSADRGEDDNKVIGATATIADYAFNVDADGDALKTPRATNTRSSRTDIITDTDKSITSSTSSHLAISEPESNILEGSRGDNRVASVASEDEAMLVEGRSGNDEISLIAADRERDGSTLATDDDSETRRRDDVVFEKREKPDDVPCFLRIVVEDVDATVEERTLDPTSQPVETIVERRNRSRSKESQTVSECSSSISGRTMSDSESESDSESGSEEGDEEEVEDDESRDENCNVKKERKEEEKNDSGDKGSAKREVSEKSEGPTSFGDDEETTVLSVSSSRGESSMTPDDRYERDLKRRSASIIDERSIEEMFDDNGWVITEQDLQQDLQPMSAIPSGFGFMVDCVEDDYDGTRTEETISRIAERGHNETSNNLEGSSTRSSTAIDDVETTPPSEERASEGPSRSRVYRQSSLGKNGWLVSDESESESERATSPGIKVPYDRDIVRIEGIVQNEASRGIEDSGIDENGWVILDDDDDVDDDGDAGDGRVGERSAQESTIRSQTTDLVTNTNIENGALLANATRSKGEQSGFLGEREETPPVAANLSIPVQMVTTVFCVSVLCYTVLTNLLL